MEICSGVVTVDGYRCGTAPEMVAYRAGFEAGAQAEKRVARDIKQKLARSIGEARERARVDGAVWPDVALDKLRELGLYDD